VERWRTSLAEGDAGAAWSLFIDRYRRLILATVRRTLDDEEDTRDAFAHVCHGLFEGDLARLKSFTDERGARFSTWLVTVVHHQTVDWLRQRDGRPRAVVPDTLSDLQRRIFRCVFIERRSHVETFELLRAADETELSFGAFLRELADTYRVVERARARGVMHYLAGPHEPLPHEPAGDAGVCAEELRGRLAEALGALDDEDRLALRLYVVDGLDAPDVARILDWPSAKSVYNRVYRGLMRIRSALERSGLGPSDL